MVSRAAVRALGVGMLVAAVSAVAAGGVAAKPSGPGPGNSPNSKQCQNGGWQNLVTSSGQSFTSEEACTSYAAGGGTLVSKTAYYEQQWQTTCQNAAGQFASNSTQWLCAAGVVFLSQATYDALATPCTDAGGTPAADGDVAPYGTIACDNLP